MVNYSNFGFSKGGLNPKLEYLKISVKILVKMEDILYLYIK